MSEDTIDVEPTATKIKKEIFQLTKDIPHLTNIQLNQQYSSLTGDNPPDTTRMWIIEAVIRLIQSKHYENNGLGVPDVIENNNKKFFSNPIPEHKKRRVPKKRKDIDRVTLDKERKKLLDWVSEECMKIAKADETKCHPKNKYSTVKLDGSVIMFIERKLRKIVVHMGGERDRKESPKISLPIGRDHEEITKQLELFIDIHLKDYTNRKDQRLDKCKDTLQKLTYLFEERLPDSDKTHSHPSGRYTTLKKGRLVLVFISQDRAKGEISFHPGGERENNKDFITTIKVDKISNISDLIDSVDKFLASKYLKYQKIKSKEKDDSTREMSRLLRVCSSSLSGDEVFHHPKNFFGLVKLEGRTLLMVKKSSEESNSYDISAWIRKQKNNPIITVLSSQTDQEISINVKDHYNKHLA